MEIRLLKPRLLLPLIQVPFTAILLWIGHYELQSPQGRLLYADVGAPAKRLAFALNAPAFLFRWCLSELVDRVHPPAGISESMFNHLIFLISVGALWYAIGWEIDRRRYAERGQAFLGLLSIGFRIALIFVGVLLGFMAVGSWMAPGWRYVPVWQTLPEGILYLLWALALVGICGSDLISYFGAKLPSSRTSS